jgi:hypothetical protein
VLLPVKSVGVMGDERSYDYAYVLRAVTSTDGMTADTFAFSHEFLGRAATRIIKRGARHQPRPLRRHLETSRHHRVGVRGSGRPDLPTVFALSACADG